MTAMDKQKRLRALLNPTGSESAEADTIVFLPDDNDDSAQANLKRKVISLGKNVLRILDSGNVINKTGVSKKLDQYLVQVKSDLQDDPAQSFYTALLGEISDVIVGGAR